MWVDVYEKTRSGNTYFLFNRDLPTGGSEELQRIYEDFCYGKYNGNYIDSDVIGWSKERDYDTGDVTLYIKTSSWR